MPDATREEAHDRLEGLRQAIGTLPMCGGREGFADTSVAIGIAVAGDRGAESLLLRAEAALRQAKAEGRNPMVLAG